MLGGGCLGEKNLKLRHLNGISLHQAINNRYAYCTAALGWSQIEWCQKEGMKPCKPPLGQRLVIKQNAVKCGLAL